MSAQLSTAFRGGTLSEYLALYLLSNIGIAVPVARQDDHGYDFICNLGLGVPGKQLIRFGHSFLVQIKSNSSEIVEFGGVNSRGEWLKHELDWIFGLDLPFMVGIADKAAHSLSLYSTSIMWILRYQKGGVGKVRFIPDEAVPPAGYLETKDKAFEAEGTDGRTYEVCLGKPVMVLNSDLLTHTLALADAKALLNLNSSLELQNIAFRHLGIHTNSWLSEYNTNGPFSTAKIGTSYAWNSGAGANVEEQLQSALPLLCTLAGNFAAQNNPDALTHLVGLYKLIQQHHEIPQWTDAHLKTAFGPILKD
jgi:hypothetical protein